MSLSIITNTASQLAADAVANNQTSLNQSIAQLSSGKRIVSAADDPAGLAISTEINGLLGALNQSSTNAGNASGMLQTADGAMANIGNALTTMQQLANEAADGTINNTQRSALDSQYQALFERNQQHRPRLPVQRHQPVAGRQRDLPDRRQQQRQ